jgi:hypothetical protein
VWQSLSAILVDSCAGMATDSVAVVATTLLHIPAKMGIVCGSIDDLYDV